MMKSVPELILNPVNFTSHNGLLTIGHLFEPPFEWIESVTNLVNECYYLGESGMWVEGALRTTIDEVRDLILQKRIIAAFSENELLGCIKISRQDDNTLEFGQLAVCKSAMKNGVGKRLIHYVEEYAKQNGFTRIKLEILYPAEHFEMVLSDSEVVDMDNPSVEAWKKKALLNKIYTKLNYQKVNVGDMSEFALDYPQLVHSLAIPCKYVVYEKKLD